MSLRAELARRVLQALKDGQSVSVDDALQLRNWAVTPEDALLPLEQIELLLFEKRKSKTNARLGISGMQLSKVRKIAGIGGKLTKLLSSNPGFIENVSPTTSHPP